jgi:hypothetical protein
MENAMSDLEVKDEEIAPVETIKCANLASKAAQIAKDAGYLYFFWNGSLVRTTNWRDAICEVKWKKSEFDSERTVPLAYWQNGYHYTGNIERLRNVAGRRHY